MAMPGTFIPREQIIVIIACRGQHVIIIYTIQGDYYTKWYKLFVYIIALTEYVRIIIIIILLRAIY
jgi:hypothetical protein